MARPRLNLRLFVAAYPPQHLAEHWLASVAEHADLPPHRLTPVDQVHMTLQFIGDTPAKDLERTIESVQRAASGLPPFTLAATRLIVLPDDRLHQPARLIAMLTNDPPPLLELQRRLAGRLAGKPRSVPGRGFRPHLTLCRFTPPAPRELIPQQTALPRESAEAFQVRTIKLMRSTLKSEGAEHIAITSVELTG